MRRRFFNIGNQKALVSLHFKRSHARAVDGWAPHPA
jgi:hypothetical protein